MTNQLTGNINRTRELVRAGSYLGAIILGAAAASALYTRSYTTAIAPTSMLPGVLGIAFVFLGAYLAWFIDDIVARAAWRCLR